MIRDHRGRLRIEFADGVSAKAIAAFLRTECRGKQARVFEDPLGDFVDVDFRIGLGTVCLSADVWSLEIVGTSRWSDRTIRRIAGKLLRWNPPPP